MENSKLNFFVLLEFVQKFFPQILFLPILFGGISQVISLLLISPNAIRFFSTTQAISDGLFFLVILLLFIFSSAIFLFFILISILIFIVIRGKSKGQEEEEEEEEEEQQQKEEEQKDIIKEIKFNRYKFLHEIIPAWFHLIIFLPMIIYFYYSIFRYLPDQSKSLNSFYLFGYTPLAFLGNFYVSIMLMRFIFFDKEYYFMKNINTFYFLNFTLGLITLVAFNVLSNRNSNFADNFDKLKEKFCCEEQGIVDVLYYNDKYIFLNRKCKNNSQELIIAKFDELFEYKQ